MTATKTRDILDWICDFQILDMKIPAKRGDFYIDLGLFLLFYKKIPPERPFLLVNCQFLGLFEMDSQKLCIIALAKFDLPEKSVTTKGYFLTDLFGDELYELLPSKKGEFTLEAKIDGRFIPLTTENEIPKKQKFLHGKYKERFIPLICTGIMQKDEPSKRIF